jgi:hypothetical protein
LHFIILILLSLSWPLSADESRKPWAQEAFRLSGESEQIRQRAIRRLTETSQLDDLLKAALHDDDRNLALDVIAALHRTPLMPALMESSLKAVDPDGQVHLTLNALLDAETRPKLISFYQVRISASKNAPLSTPATLAILDGMSLMEAPLSSAVLLSLLESPNHDTRMAVMLYVKQLREKTHKDFGATVLKKLTEINTPKISAPSRVAPPKLRVGIFFGYKDARPLRFVGDRYERATLTDRLTAPCTLSIASGLKLSAQSTVCGFVEDPESDGRFVKSLEDRDGKLMQIEVHVVESSESPDDDWNRLRPEQRRKSEKAHSAFLDSLAQDDAVFYIGHSRDGGGPDFSPPRLASNKHVNYAWYHAHPRGFRDLKNALKKTARRPKLLGLFSCYAGKHFARELGREFPEMRLVATPGWAYFSDSMAAAVSTLAELLEKQRL